MNTFIKRRDISRCDACEHSELMTTLVCMKEECDNIISSIVVTSHGEYDNNNIESMLSYCMPLRETNNIAGIIIYFGWFSRAIYNGPIPNDDKATEVFYEYAKEIDWNIPIISMARLFVKFCEKEHESY